jgi:hypothetical protein
VGEVPFALPSGPTLPLKSAVVLSLANMKEKFTWPLGSMAPATLPCLVGPSACFHWAGPLAPGPVELNVMSSPVVRLMVT